MKTYEFPWTVWLWHPQLGEKLIAAFALRGGAEDWARAQRNKINRDAKRGTEWHTDGVRVKDEVTGRFKVEYMTATGVAKSDERMAVFKAATR